MATAWLFLLVAGCGRSPTPPRLYVGGPSGVIGWAPPADTDHPVPGIAYGMVYHLGTAFVVWSDAPGGGGWRQLHPARRPPFCGYPFDDKGGGNLVGSGPQSD
jgi:hypothetical protein